jgi:hypothetical protein
VVDHLSTELVGGQVHAVIVVIVDFLLFILGYFVAHGKGHLQARNEQLVLRQRL